MTIRFERYRASGLVTAEVEDEVPVSDMREFLHLLATDPDRRPTDPMLVRVRSISRMPPIGDIRVMISELRSRRRHFRGPIAVVAPDRPVLISSRMAASLCQLAGFDVEAFLDMGDAQRWLARRTANDAPRAEAGPDAPPPG